MKQDLSIARRIYEDVPSTIETSLFTFNLNDVDYIAKIKDDGQGNLMVVSNVGGVVQLLKDRVGTVNYTTGDISITELVYEGIVDYINIFGRTKKFDLETKTNKILQIDPEYLTVTASGIRE